jgi:acyl dehydratase
MSETTDLAQKPTDKTLPTQEFGPFPTAALARYAEISGDDNPLHLDPAIAQAAGLEAPPIQGMLMLSCFEPALLAWRPDLRLLRLSGKFLRPVLAGEKIVVSGRIVKTAPDGCMTLRLMAHGVSRDLAILAEATVSASNESGSDAP